MLSPEPVPPIRQQDVRRPAEQPRRLRKHVHIVGDSHAISSEMLSDHMRHQREEQTEESQLDRSRSLVSRGCLCSRDDKGGFRRYIRRETPVCPYSPGYQEVTATMAA